MTDQIGIGVVGLGIGRWHVEEFSRLEGVRIAAICDTDETRRETVRRDFEVPWAGDDYRAMMEADGVDAVVVALPNHLHEPVAVAALAAGRHVLCEKPLAHDLESGRRLAAAAASRPDLVAVVGMKFRFSPNAHALSRMTASGRIGVPYYGCNRYVRPAGEGLPEGWFRRRAESGGGALIDNGVHLLDLNWYLMGCPRPLRAFGRCNDRVGRRIDPGIDVDDFASGLISFENDAAIAIENSWGAYVNETIFEVRVLGDRGGFEYISGDAWIDSDGRPRREEITDELKAGPTQFEHFVGCVRGDCENRSTFADGLTVLAMLSALYASDRTGQAEPVDLTGVG